MLNDMQVSIIADVLISRLIAVAFMRLLIEARVQRASWLSVLIMICCFAKSLISVAF